jgi:tRNA G18 (ribose-2'-O)-methylase SpoU
MSWTKRKFIGLSAPQQHKKCAELLRSAMTFSPAYEELIAWMGLPSLPDDPKILADRYHWHLHEAGLDLKEHNLLAIRTGDHAPQADFGPIAIVLDNIRSAFNVGSILRTSEAFRLGSVYFFGHTPFITNEKVIRTSMGASSIVPCYQHVPIEQLPRPLIALETSDAAIPIGEFVFPEVFTLALGNEEYGISEAVLKEADHLVEIPLVGMKNSLNVACAFAIAAAEIRKCFF